jgi:hypothetical protein
MDSRGFVLLRQGRYAEMAAGCRFWFINAQSGQ